MLALIGTVPDNNFPLVAGNVTLENKKICISGKKVSVNRGTPTLLAATIKAAESLGEQMPFAFLIGDIGRGDGSKKLFQYLIEHLRDTLFHTITFRYVQPMVDWQFRILEVVREISPIPVLIADASAMYMAKMAGQSANFELFTPDIGELAFIADEMAPHPFYTRGFILHEENRTQELIARAYKHGDASRYMLVKGIIDYIVNSEGIQGMVDAPVEESKEAIGGTGDTLTGIVSALSASGMHIKNAAILGAKINRMAGLYANPTPATQVMEIIEHIPQALKTCMTENP